MQIGTESLLFSWFVPSAHLSHLQGWNLKSVLKRSCTNRAFCPSLSSPHPPALRCLLKHHTQLLLVLSLGSPEGFVKWEHGIGKIKEQRESQDEAKHTAAPRVLGAGFNPMWCHLAKTHASWSEKNKLNLLPFISLGPVWDWQPALLPVIHCYSLKLCVWLTATRGATLAAVIAAGSSSQTGFPMLCSLGN